MDSGDPGQCIRSGAAPFVCVPQKDTKLMGKFKKNVTVQYFYPYALNMEYFYLNLSLKGVI